MDEKSTFARQVTVRNGDAVQVSPLIVFSVYAGGALDRYWLDTQRQALAETTSDYEHCVYLGASAERELFSASLVIGQAKAQGQNEHLEGLEAFREYVGQAEHRAVLVLDSDAFPVTKGWEQKLNAVMTAHRRDSAAAVRVENLDLFPHPSVAYSLAPNRLAFGLKLVHTLLDIPRKEIACTPLNAFPLLRTNVTNVHPLLAAIYFDMFYHHGCGSREFRMKSMQAGYYAHLKDRVSSPGAVLDALQADRSAFIRQLRFGPTPVVGM